MRRLVPLLCLLLLASPAAAQDRSPAARRTLVDLAYTLGRSHALALACQGGVQTWRARMARLRELEAPDAAYDRQLVDGFNTGYLDAQARFPSCTAGARAELVAAAAHGRDLSRVLAGAR